MNSQTCFIIHETVSTEDLQWVASAICTYRCKVASVRRDFCCTDTSTDIRLKTTFTIKVVKGIDHKIPSLNATVFMSAVNHTIIWAKNVSWETSTVNSTADVEFTVAIGYSCLETETVPETISNAQAAEQGFIRIGIAAKREWDIVFSVMIKFAVKDDAEICAAVPAVVGLGDKARPGECCRSGCAHESFFHTLPLVSAVTTPLFHDRRNLRTIPYEFVSNEFSQQARDMVT